MARWPILKLIEHLRHSAAKSTTEQMSDVRLIQRFAADRDEAAFEVLVQRYGPMVFGVCLRVLGNAHDAEDAFQATFLVLAKKSSLSCASRAGGQLAVGGGLPHGKTCSGRRRSLARTGKAGPYGDGGGPCG